ncbi:MAG: DUF4276 family protein [Treponema sp.]|nr:DUF4276 family protein [Treponema sp.]
MKENEMHFEFLVEDQSGAKAMDILIPKLLKGKATYRIIRPYKGLGCLPKDLRPKSDAGKRILLAQLPRLLRGYGKVPNYGCVIIICDLDDKIEKQFLSELNGVLNSCSPKPDVCFCLAIEEFEAWYLGDLAAVRKAYPKAKDTILSGYKNDSICGTWELLADAVCKGGSRALIKEGWQAIGKQKSVWAEEISPYMNVDSNISPSFKKMLLQLRSIAAKAV